MVIHGISLLIFFAATVLFCHRQPLQQPKRRAIRVKYCQVFHCSWLGGYLSVSSSRRKENGLSSGEQRSSNLFMAIQYQIIQSICPDPACWHLSPPSSPFVGWLSCLGIRDAVTHHQSVKWETRALCGCQSGESLIVNKPAAVNPQLLEC